MVTPSSPRFARRPSPAPADLTARTRRVPRSGGVFWLLAIGSLVLLAVLGIGVGAVPLSPADTWDALRGAGDPTTVAIVRVLRLPRVVAAALIGAALAMSGAALQGALRNSLAEPYLLGVSGGAAVGAVIAMAVADAAAAIIPVAAFAGSVVAVAVVVLVARAAGGRSDPRVLVLAGVIVGAFANAAIMVVLANAPPNTVRGALWWMMGSLADAQWRSVGWLAIYVAVGGSALIALAREIDVLSLGEEGAASLGVDVDRAGIRIFLLASLLAAATVAAAGLVGFVGLVVPHIVRAGGIHHHRRLLIGSAVAGAGLVIGADIIARAALPPAELPLGAVTALLGVPFFLARLRRAG
jgi:iron complex transport system permease protein